MQAISPSARICAVAVLAAGLALHQCSITLPPLTGEVVHFEHVIIDARPNAGTECCTDVCALGDLNGDGFVDIVIGGEGATGPGLVWYEYPTWRKHAIAVGEFTTDGQAADVDGDGKLDIIISDANRGIFWYQNPGDSAAVPWREHLLGRDYGHDLEAGDIEGDGDLDVVTCDKSRVVLWEQTAAGTWIRSVVLVESGEGLALADLDSDGDLDIVHGGWWLETPASLATGVWQRHAIDASWPRDTRVRAADLNQDGRPDVVLSVSESHGPLAWFEAPADLKNGIWQRRPLAQDDLVGAHSLQIADVNADGRQDVIVAEMHTSPEKRVMVYFNGGEFWLRQIIATTGSHNLRVGDLGNDGDVDIVGKNFAGRGRVIEMWENRLF